MTMMKTTRMSRRGGQQQDKQGGAGSDKLPSKPFRTASSSLCPTEQKIVPTALESTTADFAMQAPQRKTSSDTLESHLTATPKTTNKSLRKLPCRRSPESVLHLVLHAPQRQKSLDHSELESDDDEDEQDSCPKGDDPLMVPQRQDSISIESWGRRSKGSLSSLSSMGWHSGSLSSSLVWSKTSFSNLETIDESQHSSKPSSPPPPCPPYEDDGEDKQDLKEPTQRPCNQNLVRPKLGTSSPSCPNGFFEAEDDSISTLGWNNSSSISFSNLQTIDESKDGNSLPPCPTHEDSPDKQDLKELTQLSYNQNLAPLKLGISPPSCSKDLEEGDTYDSISTLGWNDSGGSFSSSFTWSSNLDTR